MPKEKPKVNIGEVIRSYRSDRGLSQGDIEKRTGLLRCYISRVENGHTVPAIETLEKLARAMEPRAATPARRLQAMQRLRDAGIPVGVLVAPIIPHLNDHELESILEAAGAHGARTAGYGLLRLPRELVEVFPAWLRQNFPDRAEAVLRQLTEMRGGKLYESDFGVRMAGRCVRAELLSKRFSQARRRFGLDQPMPKLSIEHFRIPDRMVQPSLF